MAVYVFTSGAQKVSPVAKKPTKQQQIETLQRQLTERDRKIEQLKLTFDAQLQEARRRTIPFGHGDQALNFLPIAITQFEHKRDVTEFHTLGGMSHLVGGPVTATIIVEGVMLTK